MPVDIAKHHPARVSAQGVEIIRRDRTTREARQQAHAASGADLTHIRGEQPAERRRLVCGLRPVDAKALYQPLAIARDQERRA
eukprot:CAMPEP_0119488512 /NCGR_PEP_ID=MMETSP1344-20130328/14270_1 /TAXON_ID=236787 /ORGANISM="Florenciella parvula, Strain CCMP2471" /LENGTH=82 /DNA_ID=CAMNT_0007523473 /DNA_START=124 /DNA_END=369 /DNA_ORIENTATION=-